MIDLTKPIEVSGELRSPVDTDEVAGLFQVRHINEIGRTLRLSGVAAVPFEYSEIGRELLAYRKLFEAAPKMLALLKQIDEGLDDSHFHLEIQEIIAEIEGDK